MDGLEFIKNIVSNKTFTLVMTLLGSTGVSYYVYKKLNSSKQESIFQEELESKRLHSQEYMGLIGVFDYENDLDNVYYR